MARPVKGSVKRFWLGLLVATFSLLLWVNQTVRSTQLSYQIQTVEEQLKKEQRKRTQLELQRDRYLSLDTVEEIAKKKYGLVTPKEENIILLALAE